MGQLVRAVASHSEGWVFEFKPQQTDIVKTGSDNSTSERSATGVSVTVLGDDHYKQMPRVTVGVAC